MSLKYGLLGLLSYSDKTGYDIIKSFDASLSFFWQAQTSQIYRELNKMEEQGLLHSRIEFQTDKPNKRIYSITETGKTELQNWLITPMPDEMLPTRSEVLLRLFFSSTRTASENIEALKHIVAVYEEQIVRLSTVRNSFDEYKTLENPEKNMLYWDLVADFGRAYSKMCLEWADSCIKRLEVSEG